MNRIIGRCRDAVRRNPKRSVAPNLEGLEDRKLLSSKNGGQWYMPARITYSFMPDGTIIGGSTPSSLFSTFNKIAPTATWEGAFEKAAAIWQQVAGFNIALTSDDGSAQGISGNQQDDPRFGDIRIGATPESPGYLGYTILPPPINGGTDAGDIVMNSNAAWQINNDYDLLTVAIHEFGHALGMGHSAISTADMYASYTGMKQSLASDDTSGIQSIYGPVPNDPTNNTTMGTAWDLTSMIDGNAQVAYNAGYVTNYTDAEWYKVTVPSTTTGSMTVTLQSTALSSLAPREVVYNSNGVALGQALAQNTYGGTVSYTVSGVTPGQVYYFKFSAANNGAGSNGAFGVLINFGSQYQAPIAPPNTVVAQQPDQGVNGWMGETSGTKGHGHSVANNVTTNPTDGDSIVVHLGHGKTAVGDALMVGKFHPKHTPAPRHHR